MPLHASLIVEVIGYETIEVWTIKDDKYILSNVYQTPHDYSTYLPIFLKMIESFEIKK
jgi:hypothetical protein